MTNSTENSSVSRVPSSKSFLLKLIVNNQSIFVYCHKWQRHKFDLKLSLKFLFETRATTWFFFYTLLLLVIPDKGRDINMNPLERCQGCHSHHSRQFTMLLKGILAVPRWTDTSVGVSQYSILLCLTWGGKLSVARSKFIQASAAPRHTKLIFPILVLNILLPRHDHPNTVKGVVNVFCLLLYKRLMKKLTFMSELLEEKSEMEKWNLL